MSPSIIKIEEKTFTPLTSNPSSEVRYVDHLPFRSLFSLGDLKSHP